MNGKLKKICGGILTIYVLCAVVFCWLAHEHINYTKLAERYYGTEEDGSTEALRQGKEILQSFTVETDRINSVSFQLTTFGQTWNKGNVYVELFDPETGSVLAKAKCEIKNISDNAWRSFRVGVNVADFKGKELAFRLYSNVQEDASENLVGVVYQNEAVEGAGWTAEGGVLNFSVSGADISGKAFYYYIVFAVGFLLLVLYCGRQLAAERNGKMTLGLRFEKTIERYWFLMQQLVSRDFKTKYKRSVLGIFWSFLNPLLMMLVQYAVFVNLFKFRVDNYAVYLLTGIVLFNGMNDTTTQSMSSITGNASLITKVYVPKYIYPVSKVFSTSINLLLSMLPLMLVSMFTGIFPRWSWLLIPYDLVCLIVFMVGLSFILSSLMVFFRDVQFLWGVLTTAWMYATPIMYSVDILPGFMQQFERINPMYYYINFMRTIIIDGMSPSPKQFLACALFSLLFLAIGSAVFKKTQDQFVLYI
jgi:ABC-2 type transport system permease protein